MKATRVTRGLYELLFSLYCGLLIVMRENFKAASSFRDGFQTPLLWMDDWLARLWQQKLFCHCHFDPALFYASWLFLALIILLPWHFLGGPTRTKLFLCYAAGWFIVGGSLYRTIQQGVVITKEQTPEGLIAVGVLLVPRWLQWLEVIFAIGVLTYLRRKRSAVRTPLSLLSLFLHFGFWGAILYGVAWREHLTWYQVYGLLVLPFCAALALGLYLKLGSFERSSPEPT